MFEPSTPMKEERLSTSGSARIALASACWWAAIWSKEISSRRLRHALDEAGVLNGKEALRDRRIEIAGQQERAERHEKGDPLMIEHDPQRRGIKARKGLEESAAARFAPPPLGRRSLAQSIGTSVSETKAEITMVAASVIANSWNSRPTTSPMKRSGISTARSETVSEMMVKPICADPLTAAS